MRRFFILTRALVLTTLREPAVLFWNLAFPVLLLVLYVLIFGEQARAGRAGFVQWIVPGVVTLNILSFGLIGSTSLTMQMREAGVLRRVRATPVSISTLFAVFVATNVLVCIAQTALVLAFAALAFGWRAELDRLVLSLPLMLLAITLSVALGQLVSSLSPRFAPALAIAQVLFFLQLFTTGLVMPMDLLPAWLGEVGRWLPAYAIGDLVRQPLLEGSLGAEAARNLGLAFAYLLASGALAVRFFRWESRG
ncbi:MAG: ABC transporter permease [Anaerolineae bacterium]|nr:ABC transporter permease [Anaerolineae bacterium]